MAKRAGWMIYGANGYTGQLVAVEATRRGLNPVLAGRRAGPIERLAAELNLPARVFDLGDAAAAAAALAGMAIVANCAGPFAATSAPMIETCLISRTHYLDITGEIDVFVAAQRRHAEAQAAGIVICPGVGFDVIPTDCIAAVLKEALSDATHLVLAFDAEGPMSPGTARTLVESLRLGHSSGRVRRNGMIEEVPLAHYWRRIDFAGGSAMAIAIPWGDLQLLGSRPVFPISRPMPQCRALRHMLAARSIGYAPCSHPHLVRCCYTGSPIASAAPPKNSCAPGDPVCGARCVMRQASDARHIWKLATVIA